MESSAFELIAENWNDSEKFRLAEKQLKRIISDQIEAAQHRDIEEFLQLDEAFHQTILQLTENETLLQAVGYMRGHLDRFRFLAMKELDLTEKLINDHENLFTCLTEKNAKKGVQLLRSHMGNLHKEFRMLRKQFPAYFAE